MKLKNNKIFFLVITIFALYLIYANYNKEQLVISPYPDGFNFAFTITDDPDSSRFDEQKIVYDYLKAKELRTTIAVWVKKAHRTNGIPDVISNKQGGVTCENVSYSKYLRELQEAGFEIALHTVSAGNDKRKDTINGYEKFKMIFGKYPKINIMHRQNLENIYWGKKVLEDSLFRNLIGLFLDRSKIPFSGEIFDSEYFWGDYCKKNTKYVRLWGTSDINTLKFNPSMPYHNLGKPYVNYWFSFSDGFSIENFNKLISPSNVKRLIKERGSCIVYTHFGMGFVTNGKLDWTFTDRIDRLVQKKDGWFVPASTILDRLELIKNVVVIHHENKTLVLNCNDISVKKLTLVGTSNKKYYSHDGSTYKSNSDGEIVIDELHSGEAIVLTPYDKFIKMVSNKYTIDYINFDNIIFIEKIINFENIKNILGNKTIYDFKGRSLNSSLLYENDVSILDSYPYSTAIFLDKKFLPKHYKQPGILEKYNMVLNRILLYIKHNYT